MSFYRLGASDKGQRFQFPEGLNSGYGATPIRCQAHEDHYVNVDYSVDGSIFMYAKMLDSGNLDVTSQKGSGGNLQISLTARKDEDSTETYINYLLKRKSCSLIQFPVIWLNSFLIANSCFAVGDSDLRYWNIAEIDAAS